MNTAWELYTGKNKWNVKPAVFVDMLEEDGRKILEVLERGEMSQMDELIERIKANDKKIREDLINKGRIDGIVENMINTIKNMLLYIKNLG